MDILLGSIYFPNEMKILIATGIYPPDIGGPATYSKLLFDELPKKGLSVRVLSFGEVRALPKVVRHFIYFLKLLKGSRGVDVVYAQDPVSVGLPVCLASFLLRKKFILKIVGDYAWEQWQQKSITKKQDTKFVTPEEFQDKKFDFFTELRRKIERTVAKRADKIIVPSEYLKKIVLMWGVKEEKIDVVYNAFEFISVGSSTSNRKNFIIISAGRPVPWKGFAMLRNLMPEIEKAIPEAKLVILEKESHKKVLEYLRAGDLFVLNTGYEGLSHQILEAMGMEIPIITTKVGGNPELIENNVNGLLVEFNNKEQFKEAILKLYRDKVLREKFIKNSKEKVKEFNKEKMIKETIKILCAS
ncbi:glycosyltransferase family 4 protein [Patescibacteria group bacterium]